MFDRRLLLIFTLGSLLTAAPAYAGDEDEDDDRRRRAASQMELQRALKYGKIRPRHEVLGEQQARLGGSVIEAELEREWGGGYVWKFKVPTSDGRITRVRVDPTSK